MKLLHKIIFWSHLTAGVTAGLVIFSMSFTGVVLMYEPQITEYVERHVRRVTPPPDSKRLTYDDLIARVRTANPEARPAMILIKSDPAASVAVNLGRDNTIFVNPYSGELLGGSSATRDFMRRLVDWHRWLGTEDEGRATARSITGACNLAFLWLALTGIYLWWPRSWHWRALKTSILFNARLRGKARDWNWHNVIGLWCSTVLVVLTVTASVMSYPWANDLLYTLTGSEPPRRSEVPGSAEQPPRAQRARGDGPTAAPAASFNVLLGRAQEQVPGWVTIMLRLPPRGDGPVTALIQGPDAFHPFQRSQLTLRASGDVIKWQPYANNSAGRKLRTWVRALHTGEAFGFAGQTVAGIASLGGCFLAWTGWAMAWRRFRSWRRESENLIPEESIMNVNASSTTVYQRPSERYTDDGALLQSLSAAPGDREITVNGHGPAPLVLDHSNLYTPSACSSASVLILYGTVTGNSEMLAGRLAKRLHLEGLTARVCDMAHCEPSILALVNYVLVIASTYGDGEPPEDAAPFWDTVVRGNHLDLRQVQFSVLALGNTTYDHFCKCGRDFDAALERHGAARFYPRVDCDADYDAAAAAWMDGVLGHFQRQSFAASA